MSISQHEAYTLGYQHGWYAPTHPTPANQTKYRQDSEYRKYYDMGFADGADRKAPRS